MGCDSPRVRTDGRTFPDSVEPRDPAPAVIAGPVVESRPSTYTRLPGYRSARMVMPGAGRRDS